ncbi:MAG: polysaccharide deacetylase family protein [Armatimonadetes bacterium]|nr:polysaccharide deacetylase family protein [Armatimonadota bacterium]
MPLRITNRPANTDGKVLILMYHKFGAHESRYTRTYNHFWNDLDRLYKMGFRPVTIREYADNKMNLPPGSSPVVLTFDDAHPSQLRFLKDGSIDPNCAVAIWQKFAKLHPDFPVKGVFYVVTTMMWAQPKLVDKKIELLKSLGSQVSNHTMHHPFLNKCSDEKARKEIAGAAVYLTKHHVDGADFALPYGAFPRNHALTKQFKYNGKIYTNTTVALAGDCPAPSPTNKHFNRYRIPRVIGQNEYNGIETWLKRIQAGKVSLYVAP